MIYNAKHSFFAGITKSTGNKGKNGSKLTLNYSKTHIKNGAKWWYLAGPNVGKMRGQKSWEILVFPTFLTVYFRNVIVISN